MEALVNVQTSNQTCERCGAIGLWEAVSLEERDEGALWVFLCTRCSRAPFRLYLDYHCTWSAEECAEPVMASRGDFYLCERHLKEAKANERGERTRQRKAIRNRDKQIAERNRRRQELYGSPLARS
jgi:hypothetical protein